MRPFVINNFALRLNTRLLQFAIPVCDVTVAMVATVTAVSFDFRTIRN